MRDYKDEMIERERVDPEHWTARTCVICGDKFRKFFRDWERDIENDIDYCPECIKEEKGHKD